MYEYHNTEKLINEEEYIPNESLFFLKTGKNIESMVDGYMTANVENRELMSPSVTLDQNDVIDGAHLTNKRFGSREITITYVLRANSDRDFRLAFNRLNAILQSKEPFDFYFYDETEYYYTGVVSSADSVKTGTNQVISKFTITCLDPYKKSVELKSITGKGHFKFEDFNLLYSVKPEKIVFDFTGSSSATYIQDGTDRNNEIIIVGQFGSGDQIAVVPRDPEKGFVYFFKTKAPERLDTGARIDSFTLENGNEIVASSNANVTIYYREMLL